MRTDIFMYLCVYVYMGTEFVGEIVYMGTELVGEIVSDVDLGDDDGALTCMVSLLIYSCIYVCIYFYIYLGVEFVGEDVSDVDLEGHDGAPTYMRVCTVLFMYLCVYLSMCIWAWSS